MKAAIAGLAITLAFAATMAEAPAAPGKGGNSKGSSELRRCIPHVLTKRLCLGGRMVTCQFRVGRHCRIGARRCNHPNVIIPCSPPKQL